MLVAHGTIGTQGTITLSTITLLSKDEARRIAANIAKVIAAFVDGNVSSLNRKINQLTRSEKHPSWRVWVFF